MAAYGFLSKGNAVPQIEVVLPNGTDTLSNPNILTKPKFWDNYPLLVLKTKEESLSPQMLTESGINFTNVSDAYKVIFFRCHFGSLVNDSITAVKVIASIRKTGSPVILLLDKDSRSFIRKIGLYEAIKGNDRMLEKDLPLTIEGYGLSYFFRLVPGFRVDDILIPRAEIPEVTERYLEEEKKG
jgi:hypothetical protein